MMCSVARIALLALVVQAHAQEPAANDMSDPQMSTDKLVDELMLANMLAERALNVLFHKDSDADMDATTLGKSNNLGVPLQANAPISTSYMAPSYGNREESMLQRLLGLRGGVKAMKAMKSPMKAMVAKATKAATPAKSPAKSPVKSPTPAKAPTPMSAMKSPMSAMKSPMKSPAKVTPPPMR